MYFENDFAIYEIMEGVLHIAYKSVVLKLEEVVLIVAHRLDLQEGQSMPILCDIRAIRKIDKAARVYLSIEGSVFIKALAFIDDLPVSKSLSSYYLYINGSGVPTKTFGNEKSALQFLSLFKK